MNATQVDVVVMGGGIGGSGLAAVLAAGGLSVTVLDRTIVFPDRVRGEMYVPWGVAIADELGLLQPLLDAGARFTTASRYLADLGRCACPNVASLSSVARRGAPPPAHPITSPPSVPVRDSPARARRSLPRSRQAARRARDGSRRPGHRVAADPLRRRGGC